MINKPKKLSRLTVFKYLMSKKQIIDIILVVLLLAIAMCFSIVAYLLIKSVLITMLIAPGVGVVIFIASVIEKLVIIIKIVSKNRRRK